LYFVILFSKTNSTGFKNRYL